MAVRDPPIGTEGERVDHRVPLGTGGTGVLDDFYCRDAVGIVWAENGLLESVALDTCGVDHELLVALVGVASKIGRMDVALLMGNGEETKLNLYRRVWRFHKHQVVIINIKVLIVLTYSFHLS